MTDSDNIRLTCVSIPKKETNGLHPAPPRQPVLLDEWRREQERLERLARLKSVPYADLPLIGPNRLPPEYLAA